MKKCPLIIAHRGWSGRFTENTLPAIRAALELGVDFVEIDIHETRDGELVVFHDYRLRRLCGVRGRLRNKTLAEIKELTVARSNFIHGGAGLRACPNTDAQAGTWEKASIPTLAEVLRVCRGKARVLIEIKRADPRKVAAEIENCGMEQNVIVFSLSIPRMKQFAEANPDIPRFGLVARRLRSSLFSLRSSVGVQGIGLSRRLVKSRSVVERIHRRGLKLFVWTVNRPSEMLRLIDWGVDGLITNHPDRAKSCLARR